MHGSNARYRSVLCTAGLAIVAAALSLPAEAQTPNTTVANVNLLNLLSPFLNLNATPVGQSTLAAALNGTSALNSFAAGSPTAAGVSISDKTIFSGNSTSITLPSGSSLAFGPGANLGGGLPVQQVQQPGTIAPAQAVGGLGALGAAYQAAVAPNGAAAPAFVTLLNNAYTFNSNDLGVAKNYFANGTIDGANTAVAATGTTLPTANGLPNRTDSVYDLAFNVKNTGANQDIYGDSRPVQVSNSLIPYDPTALSGLATNPSFPSGHTTYAFTDSTLIGMAVPQFFQSMLLRASEYGQSRIELGVHYPLDIVGSRALASYDLAQQLSQNPQGYLQTNVATGATAQNLNTQFQAGAKQLDAYLSTQTGSCGGSLAACAANDSYNTYTASTYGNQPFATQGATTAATDAAIYTARLTLGLPTLSFTQAPREQAPAGAADASILLATLYGGSTAAAQALAASVGGALYGNLATSSINQVIYNTENNALSAFYGTPLSYWTRINLYAAAGYFGNVTGNFTFASGDYLNTNVTVANTGVLSGPGLINGNLTFQQGSVLANTPGATPITVNGTTTLQTGSAVRLTGMYLPGQAYKLISGTGAIGVAPGVAVDTSGATGLGSTFTGSLVVAADPGLSVRLQSNFSGLASSGNQRALAAGIDTGGNAGTYGAGGTTLLTNLIGSYSAAAIPAAFDRLSGEGIAGQQQAALDGTEMFASTVMDAARGGLTSDTMTEIGQRRVWLTSFGEGANLDGRSGSGSAGWSGSLAGFAAGTDYRFATGTTIGLAAGYSDSSFNVSGRNTTGSASAGHVAIYGVQRWGANYLTGVLDGGFFSNHENRIALDAAQSGSFSATEVLGRIEGGRTIPVSSVNLTPFAGFQGASLSNDSFSEGGAGVSGLSVRGRSVNSDKLYLGGQVDTTRVFSNGMSLTPYARVAWEHEFSTDRKIDASLLSLPGSNFSVYGAPAIEDAARVVAGAKLNVTNAVALYVGFDGALSGSGQTYGGKGGLRIVW